MLEPGALEMRCRPRDRRTAETQRHGRRPEIEQREDHLQHRREARAVVRQLEPRRNLAILKRYRRGGVGAQPQTVPRAGNRQPARACRNEVECRGLWCKWPSRANASFYAVQTSSPKHRVPDCRRNSALNAQTPQSELSLADAMHQLDAGDRDRRIPEPLEA